MKIRFEHLDGTVEERDYPAMDVDSLKRYGMVGFVIREKRSGDMVWREVCDTRFYRWVEPSTEIHGMILMREKEPIPGL